MVNNVSWKWQDEENHIMYVRYKPGWTWTEHHNIVDETLKVRNHDVFTYIIVDMTDANSPKGSSTPHQRDVGQSVLMIIVTNSLLVRMIAQMVNRIRREEHLYAITKTLEEANQVIQEHRQKITS